MKRRTFLATAATAALSLAMRPTNPANAGEEPVSPSKKTATLTVKAVKLYDHGFMSQPFLLGGEDGEDKFDPKVLYRSSHQNFLIDTGSEVILVDTGMPKETVDAAPAEGAKIYFGKRINDYVSALKNLGYQPEQVTKILVTHKHLDHTGELRSFPKAKIYIAPEDADAMGLKGNNIVRVTYKDGTFHNFAAHEKITEGVYLIKARGHTNGTSIIIAEIDKLFYMMHGDVTYSDEALYENKLSVVFEDKAAARDTLNQVRTFVSENPTVYCSTHTPLGYENLEAKRIVNLKEPPKIIPPAPIAYSKPSGKYVCSVCGYTYDPEKGDPEHGIPAGTRFEDLPKDWKCPRCRRSKDLFSPA
ncbi:MAG: rubredoxin [Desulfovibrio sp.]|nr:rubredoxin [Desulfovibrio sp.]